MWPLISKNDEIYIAYKPYDSLKKRDIILFMRDGNFLLHRVIFKKDFYLYTRGDNNYKNNFEKLSKDDYIGILKKVKKKRLNITIYKRYFSIFYIFSYFKPKHWINWRNK